MGGAGVRRPSRFAMTAQRKPISSQDYFSLDRMYRNIPVKPIISGMFISLMISMLWES
jgi:hypothetical protein